MEPQENQYPVSEPTPHYLAGAPVGQTHNTPAQPVFTNFAPPTKPASKSHKKSAVVLALFVVLVLVGVFALYHSDQHTKASSTISTTKVATKTTPSVAINTWTGNGNNYNWNVASNWSLGIPKDNQILEINVGGITQPTDQYGTTSFALQDNIPNLTINKLIIGGQVSSIIFQIKGDPLSITSGIEDTITTTASAAAIPQLQVDNLINLTGDQTVQTSGNNLLTFYGTGAVLNMGAHTIQFNATGTSQISVAGEVQGTGEIYLPAHAISSSAALMFGNASPNFNGKVVIGSGDSVSVGNQAGSAGQNSTVDGLGNSNITIMNGGSMEVYAGGTSKFTVNNPILVSGKGITNSDGSVTGAIWACVAGGEEGCGASENVTFTGSVKLLGDTQLGYSTPTSKGATNTHTAYTFSNLNKNGYILNTVTDYYYNPEL